MKLFTQILILIGFVITTVNATAENDEYRLLSPDKGLFLDPSEVDFPAESDYLVIPDGAGEGAVISKQKLGTVIAEGFEDIIEVDNIFVVDKLYFWEGILRTLSFGTVEWTVHYDMLEISFRIKSSDTGFYPYVQCKTQLTSTDLLLYVHTCESENVKITREGLIGGFIGGMMLRIPISRISVSIEEYEESTAI